MMNISIFIVSLLVLQIVCLIIGRQSSKNMKNQEDYFLAGRGIRFFPLMMTFVATQVGGGIVLGSAEEAYRYGWVVLCYPLGAAIGMLLLGAGIGRKLALFKVSTIAQIFEVAYGSRTLKRIASLLSILSLFMILVGQVIASSKFMVSAGVESSLLFCLFWAIIILYTAWGGLKAVVATDMVQALFFIVIFVFGFGVVFYGADTSIGSLVTTSLQSERFVEASSKLCGWLLLPLLFMVIEQDMGQRCFAGESPAVVSKATLVAGLVTMSICVIPVCLGVFANIYGIVVPEGASVLMTVIQQMTNPAVTALVGCAVLAAIISTADSLINAIGSNISQDFQITASNKVGASQITSAAIALAALFCSFFFSNVVDMLIQSYELSVSCLFVPIAVALFKRRGNFLSAALAVGLGAFSFVIFKVVATPIPKEILSILVSAVGFAIGEYVVLTRPAIAAEPEQYS